MLVEEIEKERLEDCISAILSAIELSLTKDDIQSIKLQTGGLFNYLLRIETNKGTFFFKQYLDNIPNKIFNPPKIPAIERANLAFEVQRLAIESVRKFNKTLVPKIRFFDKKRNAFLMDKTSGDVQLIQYLSKGEIPESFIEQFPMMLGCLHENSFQRFPLGSVYENRIFRDYKLKIQYDDIASQLEKNESEIVISCKKKYQSSTECVTHGDINSRNIIVGNDSVEVIDFEQSHLGSPVYDLAYILCEVFISLNYFENLEKTRAVITKFLDNYFKYFSSIDRIELETDLTTHLAIQVIYRFWGPSRASWTFYLDDTGKEKIIKLSRNLLIEKKPISDLL